MTARQNVASHARVDPILQARRLAGERAIDLQADDGGGGNDDFRDAPLARFGGCLSRTD
jgi:hypothetical protein